MKRSEYTGRVLSAMHRVTAAEREAIRAELDAHMEDHMEALLDLGYEPELAEARTLERMGDPEEVGRELDKQYPRRWLILQRFSVLLAVFLAVTMLFNVFEIEHFPGSCLVARIQPASLVHSELDTVFVREGVDIRQTVGNDILRIVEVSVGEYMEPYGPAHEISEPERMAEVLAVAYDKRPFGLVATRRFSDMTLEDQRGEKTGWCGEQYYHWRWTDNQTLRIGGKVEVAPDDTYVILRCDRFGEPFELQISLPQEDIP